MTVVFKSNAGIPHTNLGTTLFIRRTEEGETADQEQPIVNNKGLPQVEQEEEEEGEDEEGEEERKETWARERDLQECVTRSRGNQGEALRSREKRLMAHMGLKGKLERDWKRAVKVQSVTDFAHLRPLSGQGSQGGSMLVVYNTSSAGHTVTRAKFLAEDSSRQSHVAFALVYEIDRLLGLYHTPPAVPGFITPSVVERFSADKTWQSAFGVLRHPDGTLRGLYVAPTPKVMKRSELQLQPLSQMVSEVVTFDRTQKMQLEYVLLWWLGHIAKPSGLHRGFKGHLIHVDGDMGFQELSVPYDRYFNHCQFPNVVYKMLLCFRCRQSPSPNKICYLGQEVVRRMEETGFRLADLHIQNMDEEDYPMLINDAASRTMAIVEKCIQEFGRETVLY